jgi:hypothetical protein
MGERHPTPEFVTQYFEWLKAGPPKCCHTCEYYDKKGRCIEFNAEPDKDFAEAVGECDSWMQEIPF